MTVQTKSEETPLKDADVAWLAAETVRKAHAVGLLDESPDFPQLTLGLVRKVIRRVREAGIAARAARDLERAEAGDRATWVRGLREIDALLEEAPLPAHEWRRLLDVFDRDQLARLLATSPSSVSRYDHGERTTPDEVAARLHFLALVVGDLAGAYNTIGIRRWFDRPRTALGNRAPAHLLTTGWQPEDAGPRRVRHLARALVAPAAT